MIPFEFAVRIYWEDTDAGGIVYYANYLKFFERARTEWLRSTGFQQQQLRQQENGLFVVTRAQIHYRLPARLDDELQLTLAPQKLARSSLQLQQKAFRKLDEHAPGQLLCEADIQLAWLDQTSMRPARIPAEILEKLNT